MSSLPQQSQISSKAEKRPSISLLCTHLSRNICVSWSLNVVLVVTTIVILLVASLDVVQAAFCVHLVAFCITCAVLVWTKDSKNAFGMTIGLPVLHFVLLSCIIWDCGPLLFVLKLISIGAFWFGTRLMRITGTRLVYAIEHKPKARVRITIVEQLIGASVVLLASLHLAYPELEAFSFAEIALWGCFIADVLWHFAIWKIAMKKVFQSVRGMNKIISRQNAANLNMIEGVKRRQNIGTTVGIVFAEIITCVCMMFINPALGLLLKDKSNECKQRNSVGSQLFSAFGFAALSAIHIGLWVTIYSHVLRKRREEMQTMKNESESRKALQISSLVST
jgi:hypothetical protein